MILNTKEISREQNNHLSLAIREIAYKIAKKIMMTATQSKRSALITTKIAEKEIIHHTGTRGSQLELCISSDEFGMPEYWCTTLERSLATELTKQDSSVRYGANAVDEVNPRMPGYNNQEEIEGRDMLGNGN